VLAALRAAVDERGPGCFASQRAAAKALAAVLPDSVSSIRRALSFPQSDLEAAAIDAAIRPAASATADDTHRVLAAGFGGEPVGEPLVSHPVSQGSHGEPPRITGPASPQVVDGEPLVSHDGASRAREPRRPTSPAPLRPPQVGRQSADPTAEPYVLDGPPIPTTLAAYPRHIRPSQFSGECLLCHCGLDEGQALFLAPYGAAPARMFCMDHAEAGLEIAQHEWVLAGHPVPKSRKSKPPTTPDPQE
jgi:hypothetical protein